MSTSNEMAVFLSEGVLRYASAKDAVETFEREIQAKLERAMKAHEWQNFASKDASGQRALRPGVGGADNRAIWVSLYSALDGDGSVALGLWWSPPNEPGKAVVYCARWTSRSRLVPIAASPEAPLVCAPLNSDGPRLYSVVTPESDIELLARLLLSEMNRALTSRP